MGRHAVLGSVNVRQCCLPDRFGLWKDVPEGPNSETSFRFQVGILTMPTSKPSRSSSGARLLPVKRPVREPGSLPDDKPSIASFDKPGMRRGYLSCQGLQNLREFCSRAPELSHKASSPAWL